VKLFGVNVLINAYRDDANHHGPCRSAIEDAIANPAAFGLTPIVLSGFLRVVSHRRVFKTPAPLVDAIESGCEFVTTNRDFGRFPGLRWYNTLSA